ncbi:Uncharacterised protein [Chlamydia abortus]|nr:Uncharacterised protein [Chlamydia abortus]
MVGWMLLPSQEMVTCSERAVPGCGCSSSEEAGDRAEAGSSHSQETEPHSRPKRAGMSRSAMKACVKQEEWVMVGWMLLPSQEMVTCTERAVPGCG